MGNNRITGIAKQAKGTVKSMTGHLVGDAKLVAEGQRDKTEGKIQNAIGGVEAVLKDNRS